MRHKHLSKFYYNVCRGAYTFIARSLTPIYLKITANRYQLTPRESDGTPRIIVSLCSFPVRLPTLWIVIELMMRQSVKPDMIILHLSKEQVPSLDEVPPSLLKLQERGLEIRLEEGEDLRSHKKYHYVQRRFPDDIIITIDDDVYYPYDTIECLMEAHREHPTDVIANRTRALIYDEYGDLLTYRKLFVTNVDDDTSDKTLMQIGIDGVLYPPHSLHKDLLDRDLAMRLTPTADDIWLFAMTRLNGNKVRRSKFREIPMGIQIKNNVRLYDANVLSNHNDNQLENLREYYRQTCNVDLFEK